MAALLLKAASPECGSSSFISQGRLQSQAGVGNMASTVGWAFEYLVQRNSTVISVQFGSINSLRLLCLAGMDPAVARMTAGVEKQRRVLSFVLASGWLCGGPSGLDLPRQVD